MGYFKRRLFLVWLVYLVSIISIGMMAWHFNLIQYGFGFDKSFLSMVVTAFYLITEVYLGYLVIQTSKEIESVHEIKEFLNQNLNVKFKLEQHSIAIESSTETKIINNSLLANHIKNLVLRTQHWGGKKTKLEQETLLSSLGEKIMEKNSWCQFSANVILLAGLVGTIVGIIITLWPFIDVSATAALDITQIQQSLPRVLPGIGAALFPSVFTAIYATFLAVSDKILQGASVELVAEISDVSETHVIPILEKQNQE